MIKIRRCDCPAVLTDTPQEGTHYNKKPVVDALYQMQGEKCCYCEQKIPEEGQGKAVEHFHPKSIYKHQRNDWKNLLLACAYCNGNKSNIFPIRLSSEDGEPSVVYKPVLGEPLMIDPSDENTDPEDHITFVVDDAGDEVLGLAIAKNNSQQGLTTIDVVGLFKKYYTQKRQIFISSLLHCYANLIQAKANTDNAMLKSCIDTLKLFMSAKNEFAACARVFVRRKAIDVNFGVPIPHGYEDVE